nr:MAG TPA: hypothetical protein [Caudoviricetes sp.]
MHQYSQNSLVNKDMQRSYNLSVSLDAPRSST